MAQQSVSAELKDAMQVRLHEQSTHDARSGNPVERNAVLDQIRHESAVITRFEFVFVMPEMVGASQLDIDEAVRGIP